MIKTRFYGNKPEFTHKFPGSIGSLNNQVCHVSNGIRCETEVEQHVENVKYHFMCVYRM